MMMNWRSIHVLFFWLVVSRGVTADSSIENISHSIYRRGRRLLNFGSLFGSATTLADSPYDRIAGHPVFAITTPWGSPYMNMEKLSDLDEVIPPESRNARKRGANMDESEEYRSVVLYFMDQDDALGVHGEMKQMEQMADMDIRITSFSFAKALRQAANLGNGLVTGSAVDAISGELKSPQEGGSLRYKIVPSKRQLYYAARCFGKERVGLFGETPAEDAVTAVQGNFEAVNLERRRVNKERKAGDKKRTPMQMANIHMEGRLGIPVFYAPSMKRVHPLVKRVISGSKHEAPLFFNYEDLMDAWKTLRERNPGKVIAEKPDDIEVFNLWDVLTSMDRKSFQERKRSRTFVQTILRPIQKRLPSKNADKLELDHITFVPSSRCVQYKEAISARGNGKARLRPMR